MNINILSLITFLLFIFSCQNTSSTKISKKLTLEAKWSVGDKFQYKITQTKNDITPDSPPLDIKLTRVGEMEILKKDSLGYEISWKILKTIYPPTAQMDKNIVKSYEAMMDAFILKYSADKNGRFKELLNWEDLLNFQFDIMDKIPDIIEEENGVSVNEVKQMIKQTLGSKRQIEALFIDEIKLLHSYYGVTFHTDKITFQNKYIPSIVGNPKALVNTILNIEKIDTVQNILIGQEKFELDDETKRTYHLGQNSSIKDKTSFEINYQKGYLNRLFYQRVADIHSENRTLKREISTELELLQ